MKLGSKSPLPDFDAQEGTSFSVLCKRRCGGMYRRTHKNDMPICDICGHVYKTGIIADIRRTRVLTGKDLDKYKTRNDLCDLDPKIEKLVDPIGYMVAFRPDFKLRKRPKCITERQWRERTL